MSLRFIFVAGGVLGCYTIYGILQESLLKGTYGKDDKFTFVLPLLFVATFFNYIYAHVMKAIYRPADDKVPNYYFCCAALTYLLGMITSFMALQWVSYPAQVIAKSAKPIPVLVMGVLIGRKNYPVKKYIFIFLIVTGIVLFMFKDDKKVSSSSESYLGEILLILSLLMDGLCNSLQERMMAQYGAKSEKMMLEMNKWSMIFLGAALLYTGDGKECLKFIQQYPICLTQIFCVALCGSIGQFFIFTCLTEYGTLTCSVVTTTRKFFTVLTSVILFGHFISLRQWFGVALVFLGLTLDIYYGKAAKKTILK